MEYRILGPLEVRDGDGPLPLGGAKQRALLALLLLDANRVVARERLVDLLWDERPPASAVTNIQGYVSRLRKVLPADVVETLPSGYRLQVEPDSIDLLRFEQLVAQARSADPARASRLLEEAFALWRGAPLAEFDESFARVEGGRLEELRLAALEERIAADLALGRHAQLIGELETLSVQHPHRERARGQLMLALYRSGRQSDALEIYRETRAALAEVGLEPGAALRQLERDVLTQNADLDLPADGLLSRADGNVPLPGPLVPAASLPFVGRADELAVLRALLERAESGAGGLVLLAGEAGAGKTRLARELACEAAERGTFVLYGSCEAVTTAPYQPFIEALDFLVRESNPDALDACLGAGRAELARLLPELDSAPAPAPDDPATARHRLESAVAELLARVSRHQPLLVVLDDVHWADPASLHLLRRLARAAPETRVLLVAAHRDRSEDLRPEFPDALAELVRLDGVTRLKVAGLTGDDVGDLIRRLTDASDDDAVTALAASLHIETDGLPFLVSELWRLLLEAGVVETSEGAPRLRRPIEELRAPQGVREVVRHRLSRLSPSTVQVLELASVAGTQFELRVLDELVSRSRLVAALEEALGSGTIEELPGPGLPYRFAHDLVRRALYDRLSRIRRAELHHAVGEALERVHAADTDRVAAALAHHFTLAASLGDAQRAVEYNLRAADAAMAAFGIEEAAERLATALELGISDGSRRGRVQLELGRALWLVGRQRRAAEALDDALDSACVVGDERLEWYVRLERAGLRRDRDAAELETLARTAVDVFQRLGDELGLARARRRIALAASDRCAFAQAARESEQALMHAVAAGDRQEETRIVDALCTALLYGPAPATSALGRCRDLLELAHGSPMRQAVILSSTAGLTAMQGDLAGARSAFERAEAIYTELELPVFIGALSVISGSIELLAGDAAEAERTLRRGIELMADRGTPDAIAYRSALLSLALLTQGKHADAAAVLETAEPVRLITRITHGIAAGRVHDDLARARAAVDLASETEAASLHADARASLADLLESRGDEEALLQRQIALELYERKENHLAALRLRPPVARARRRAGTAG